MKQHVSTCMVFLVLLGLMSTTTAYVIEGNSVILEDEYASLIVTPHTATSPVNNFKQEFTLCNKTDVGKIIYSAYLFNQPLNSGKIELWQKPYFEWVEHEKVCNYDFNYVINEDTDQNPNRAWCFETRDENGTDTNFVYWEQEFHTGNVSTATIQYDVNEMTFGNQWVDVTDSFQTNHTILDKKHIYPNIQGTIFLPNACKTWRMEYNPKETDLSKKWELWLWTNTLGWNCILTDTCQKTLKLDPWWDAGGAWGFKQKITAHTSSILTGDVTGDHVILVDINSTNTDFWDNVEADGKDVRFVNVDEDAEFDYHFESFNSGTDRMIAWVEITDTFPSASNLEFYVYYGNGDAVDAQDEAGTYPSTVTAALHMDGGGTVTNDEGTGNFDFTNTNTPTDTTGKIGTATLYDNTSSQYSTNATLGDAAQTKNSIAFWFNPTENIPRATIIQRLTMKINTGSSYPWSLVFYNDEGRMYTYRSATGSPSYYTTKNSWNAGEWYHIVDTFDSTQAGGSDSHIVYINGVADASSITTGTFGDFAAGTDSDAFIGSSNEPTYYLDGAMDEMKFFLDTSLTADEVKLMYASENIGLLEFGSQEAGVTDSCTCPTTGHWEITNGDSCSLSTECNLTTGNLHIVEGQLTITSTGTLNIQSGYYAFIQQDNNLHIQSGGNLKITK